MLPTRVIIFHGAHCGPDTNWFPWLDAELSLTGFEVLRLRFPTPQGQSLAAWSETYDMAVAPLLPKRTILVGHSLGAAMALRVVKRTKASFSGLFLAAGFIGALGLPDYDPINASFFATPFDWTKIRERIGVCRCWAADDDPYVPLARSEELAADLRASPEVIRGGGHLNDETGFTTFPALKAAILEVAGSRHE
ncbi:MAG: alpha/beta hydrolase [Acidocella sp.]|nr:alpha/beta hydrolase [Acidocella sp.]